MSLSRSSSGQILLTGAGGDGYLSLISQSSTPSSSSGVNKIYTSNAGHLSILNAAGNLISIDSTGITAARTLSVPDSTGIFTLDSNTQTLTGKTIVGGSGGNDITANNLPGVAVSGTAAVSQALLASSSSTASWSFISDASITGVIEVNHGGTGAASLTTGRFVVGNGTSAVDVSKVVPTGVVVGTTDTQTLTGKTLSSVSNTVDATQLRTFNISATAPTDGQALVYNGGTVSWTPTTIAAGATTAWVIKDVKTVGTSGGSLTANTWTTRDLNTLTGSVSTDVTLSANQITFAAGTYYVRADVPGRRILLHKAKLYSITAAADLIFGLSASSSNNDSTNSISIVEDYITFGATTVTEIRHYGTRTQATDGLGIATGIAGTNEIYTTVYIQKIS